MLTIVHHLLLRYLVFVPVKNACQGIGHFGHYCLTDGVELCQVIGMLHQGIKCTDFEGGYGELEYVSIVLANGGGELGEGLVVEDADRKRDERVASCRCHGRWSSGTESDASMSTLPLCPEKFAVVMVKLGCMCATRQQSGRSRVDEGKAGLDSNCI